MSSIIKAQVIAVERLSGRQAQSGHTADYGANHGLGAGRPTEAMSVLRQAKRQAAALLAKAQEESAQLKEQARAEGYAAGFQEGKAQGLREGTAEGLAAGRNEGLEKAQELVRQAEAMLAEAEEERRKAFADLEQEVVELAFTIAEKIVQRHIEREDAYLVEVLTSAMQQLDTKGKVLARVHAKQLERVIREQKLHQLTDVFEVLPDETLAPGDFLLETEAGIIDGRLATRLDDIHAALESVVEE